MPVTYNDSTFSFYRYSGDENDSARMVLRFVERDTTIRFYVTDDTIAAGAYDPATATEVCSITATSVGRWFGFRERAYGYFAQELKGHLRQLGYLTELYFDTYPLDRLAEAVYRIVQQKWPPCVCGESTTDEHDHAECSSCQEQVNVGSLGLCITYETCDGDIDTTTYRRCESCAREGHHGGLSLCNHCGNSFVDSNTTVVATQMGYPLCRRCADDQEFCTRCDAYHITEHYIQGLDVCRPCADDDGLLASIQEWDYVPDYTFYPPIPADPRQPLYIGIEIEIATSNLSMEPFAYHQSIENLAPLIYAKEDSSVRNGFELVSHPMAPRWALEQFPFEAVEAFHALGAYETHESTGTHIHLNKESLTPAHLWKFLQIHFRLPKFCQLVGGRGDVSYASFEANDMTTQRANLLDLVQKKDRELDTYDRYLAINLKNEYTIELRYMRGSIRANEIRKNIEWALALYEFSAYLSIADVRNGALDNQGYLLHWIQSHDYPQLIEWIDRRVPKPMPLESRP